MPKKLAGYVWWDSTGTSRSPLKKIIPELTDIIDRDLVRLQTPMYKKIETEVGESLTVIMIEPQLRITQNILMEIFYEKR